MTNALALVRCTDCRHFRPDTEHPAQGLGTCAVQSYDRMAWPLLAAHCGRFAMSRPLLDQIAAEVSTDPEAFAAGVWADGIYTHPQHIRRLAQEIELRGFPTQWRTDQ